MLQAIDTRNAFGRQRLESIGKYLHFKNVKPELAAEDARKPRRQGGVAVDDARWKYVEFYFDGQERVLRTACASIEAMLAG